MAKPFRSGNHELSFVLIPMVHWPETMVTLDAKNKVLFSGDAFGCFGALNGGIIDTEINCETFWLEMVRYYSNIVGKYGSLFRMPWKKLAGVELDYICSTHGPVWHEHIEKVIGMYDKMSKYRDRIRAWLSATARCMATPSAWLKSLPVQQARLV